MIATRDQAARFIGIRFARMRDDRVAELRRQNELLRWVGGGTRCVRYAPPAIAGMTITSLPSGTGASVPPLLRASSSPM